MPDSTEKRPKRKRITTTNDIPVATSNQHKKTIKVNLPEKKEVPIFKETITNPVEETPQIVESVSTPVAETVSIEKEVTTEEKPKRSNKRKTTKSITI